MFSKQKHKPSKREIVQAELSGDQLAAAKLEEERAKFEAVQKAQQEAQAEADKKEREKLNKAFAAVAASESGLIVLKALREAAGIGSHTMFIRDGEYIPTFSLVANAKASVWASIKQFIPVQALIRIEFPEVKTVEQEIE